MEYDVEWKTPEAIPENIDRWKKEIIRTLYTVVLNECNTLCLAGNDFESLEVECTPKTFVELKQLAEYRVDESSQAYLDKLKIYKKDPVVYNEDSIIIKGKHTQRTIKVSLSDI